MPWTKIDANATVMLTAQWVFRAENAPVCSLKKGETPGTWVASLLNRSGISCVICHTSGTLEQAQRNCEKELRLMGWTWGAEASDKPPSAATTSA